MNFLNNNFYKDKLLNLEEFKESLVELEVLYLVTLNYSMLIYI